MKTIILIETAEELLKFANPNRTKGDTIPFLGNNAKLIFENNFATIRIEGTDNFELSEKITFEAILKEFAKTSNLQIHLT